MSRVLTILAVGLASVACHHHDASEPIYLVPDSGWGQNQLDALSVAAELWNAEVGTAISVTRQPPPDSQQVPVISSELLCAYHPGVTTFPGPRIGVCSLDSAPLRLLLIASHEIGHALNIESHADDPLAVMAAAASNEGTHFRPEDRSLFTDANPGHMDRRGTCDVLRDLGWSRNRPVMVQPRGVDPVVIWADDGALRLVSLDASASSKGDSRQIATAGYARWIRAWPVEDGFVVTWEEQGSRHASRVRPAAAPAPPVRLELPALPDDDRTDVSDVSIGDDLFVAITDQTEEPLGYSCRIARLDLATGAARAFTSPVSGVWCQVAASGDALLLASRTESTYGDWGAARGSAVIARLAPTGAVLEQLDLGDVYTVTVSTGSSLYYSTTLHLLGGPERAYVVVNRPPDGDLAVHRVETAGKLALGASVSLPSLGDTETSLVALQPWAGELALATTSRRRFPPQDGELGAILSEDVRVASLDPITLQTRRPWTRVSPEALTPSVNPQLGVSGGRLVVMWRDEQGELDLVRSRCLW